MSAPALATPAKSSSLADPSKTPPCSKAPSSPMAPPTPMSACLRMSPSTPPSSACAIRQPTAPPPHSFMPALPHNFVISRKGFPLIELMVAVALVLLLILGINEVFRLTSDTMSAGQRLSTAVRDQRSVRRTFENDFNNVAADAPFMIIRNQAVPAFHSPADKATNAGLVDGSGNP